LKDLHIKPGEMDEIAGMLIPLLSFSAFALISAVWDVLLLSAAELSWSKLLVSFFRGRVDTQKSALDYLPHFTAFKDKAIKKHFELLQAISRGNEKKFEQFEEERRHRLDEIKNAYENGVTEPDKWKNLTKLFGTVWKFKINIYSAKLKLSIYKISMKIISSFYYSFMKARLLYFEGLLISWMHFIAAHILFLNTLTGIIIIFTVISPQNIHQSFISYAIGIGKHNQLNLYVILAITILFILPFIFCLKLRRPGAYLLLVTWIILFLSLKPICVIGTFMFQQAIVTIFFHFSTTKVSKLLTLDNAGSI